MPGKTEYPKLPQRKLREFLGTPITIEKIVLGKRSSFGPYVLLITKTDSIISSGEVVLKRAAELAGNLPVTVTPVEIQGKNHAYLDLQ